MGLRRSPTKIAAAAPQCRGAAAAAGDNGLNSPDTMKSLRLLLPPPPSKDDFDATMKQQALMVSGTSLCRFEPLDSTPPSSSDLRRIGKMRMTWEESVSLWAEEGESEKGRFKMEGLSFLNADELTFLDPFMASCSMEAFEDGPLTLMGFSVM